jgi:hypothetical protein
LEDKTPGVGAVEAFVGGSSNGMDAPTLQSLLVMAICATRSAEGISRHRGLRGHLLQKTFYKICGAK